MAETQQRASETVARSGPSQRRSMLSKGPEWRNPRLVKLLFSKLLEIPLFGIGDSSNDRDSSEPAPTFLQRKTSSTLRPLVLVRSNVACTVARTRHTPLICRQQPTITVSATTRVACINCRTSRGNGQGRGISTVVLQYSEFGIDLLLLARTVETAGGIAAQVKSP